MVQLTNFFTDQPAAPARNQIVEALIAQGLTQQPAATTPIQGIANLSQTMLAVVLAKRDQAEREALLVSRNKTMAAGLAALKGTPDRTIEVDNPVVSALANRPGEPLPMMALTVPELIAGQKGSLSALAETFAGGDDIDLQNIGLNILLREPEERKTARDRNDVLRDLATGEPVFPGVEDPQTVTLSRDEKLAQGIPEDVVDDVVMQRKPGGALTTPFKADRSGGSTLAMKNAVALGLEPGTPEYDEYVRDATLRPQTQPQPVKGVPRDVFDGLSNDVKAAILTGRGESQTLEDKRAVDLARTRALQMSSSYRRDKKGAIITNGFTGEPEIDIEAFERNFNSLLGQGATPIAGATGQGGLTLADGQVIPEGTTFQQGNKVFIVQNGQAVPVNP